jgi:hypothetical protein
MTTIRLSGNRLTLNSTTTACQAKPADTEGFMLVLNVILENPIPASARTRGDGFNFWRYAVRGVLSFRLFLMLKFMER